MISYGIKYNGIHYVPIDVYYSMLSNFLFFILSGISCFPDECLYCLYTYL